VVLLLDGCWQQAAEAATAAKEAKQAGQRSPPQPSARGKKKVAGEVGISEKCPVVPEYSFREMIRCLQVSQVATAPNHPTPTPPPPSSARGAT